MQDHYVLLLTKYRCQENDDTVRTLVTKMNKIVVSTNHNLPDEFRCFLIVISI